MRNPWHARYGKHARAFYRPIGPVCRVILWFRGWRPFNERNKDLMNEACAVHERARTAERNLALADQLNKQLNEEADRLAKHLKSEQQAMENLRNWVRHDGITASFQSLGQYRAAVIRATGSL
jgi:hypothetical protein